MSTREREAVAIWREFSLRWPYEINPLLRETIIAAVESVLRPEPVSHITTEPTEEAVQVAFDTVDMRANIPHEDYCRSRCTDLVGEPFDCDCGIEEAITTIERAADRVQPGRDTPELVAENAALTRELVAWVDIAQGLRDALERLADTDWKSARHIIQTLLENAVIHQREGSQK